MNRPKNPRSTAGPGRGAPRNTRRTRGSAAPVVTRREEPEVTAEEQPAVRRPRVGVTRRAVVLLMVVAVLLLSYATSLRIYFATERENAANRQRIAVAQGRIADLEAELIRWNDPDHVAAEARSRLGWVVPGDTSYRVIGEDGTVLGVDDEPGTALPKEPPAPWYQRLGDSVRYADKPPTIEPEPADAADEDPATRPPITDGDRTGN